MEQIYYTQCPVGYGLGSSNGFQVKRITPGYPLTGDFRHLGMRAFPAGGRTLAPPSLRYRRADGEAEVALLTPRPMEYQTERGPWGRPGGHFAHGTRWTADEFRAIDSWPAGLFDRPEWRRSDPEPSRGRPPDPLAWTPETPRLSTAAPLGRGLAPDLLARLLTALASVSREGRTLFLLDEPDRLGPRVALLTFLFPPPLRESLTFSTYHDRPEELPGYRIHGTTPAARPNRGLLLTQGIVADLTTGAIEPRVEPAAWAVEVASWVDSGDDTSWDAFADHCQTSASQADSSMREDAGFDRLIAFGRALGRGPSEVAWQDEAALAAWAQTAGLAVRWAEARPASWWLDAEVGDGAGRAALRALAAFPEAWGSADGAGWGEVVARWFADDDDGRVSTAVRFAKAAPSNADRLAFVRSLRRLLAGPVWGQVRAGLDEAFRDEPKVVEYGKVPDAVAVAVAGEARPLVEVVGRLLKLGEPVAGVLDALGVEVEGEGHPVEPIGGALVDLFARPAAVRWALAREDSAVAWLGAASRRRLAVPDDRERWAALGDGIDADQKPALARALLTVAADSSLPDEAFVWAVEAVLLAIDGPARPDDPAWPGLYLDRSESDLGLIRKLYGKKTRQPALRGWLDRAERSGVLDDHHLGRLAHLSALTRALSDPAAETLAAVDLARLPGRDRGPVLAGLLRRDALASVPPDLTLERCGAAWPECASTGSAEFAAIADAVARSLAPELERNGPDAWLRRVVAFDRRLAPGRDELSRFAPDGLIARVVAVTNHAEGAGRAVWGLRNHLYHHPEAWKTIAEDFRSDLELADAEASPAVVERWDARIEKGRVEPFWEVVLNVCDGPRLGAVVAARAGDLATVGPLAWWDVAGHPGGNDDIRDAYARTMPMAPIAEDALSAVQNWMAPPRGNEASQRGRTRWDSPLGLARWTCIDHLSKHIFRQGLDDQARRFSVRDWCGKLPIAGLDLDDRYRLVAWVISKVEDPSALDVERVGKWLVDSGLTDLRRIVEWPAELAGLREFPASVVRDRGELARSLRDEMGRVIRDGPAGRAAPRPPSNPAGA